MRILLHVSPQACGQSGEGLNGSLSLGFEIALGSGGAYGEIRCSASRGDAVNKQAAVAQTTRKRQASITASHPPNGQGAQKYTSSRRKEIWHGKNILRTQNPKE